MCILNSVKKNTFLLLLSLLVCGGGSISPFSEAWTLSFIRKVQPRPTGVLWAAASTRGKKRQPNVKTFLQNAQANRVQRTMAIGHGGNVRKRKE